MLAEARSLIAERLGLDFPARRADDLARALAGRSLPSLREQPTSGPEWRALIGALTVGESYFFRELEPLERALADVVAARREQRRLTIWSAGCATGEEPYTLAMLAPRDWQVTILGTDVDVDALDAARAGVYGDWALRDTPEWARAAHFRPLADRRFELSRQIRAMVAFAPLNIATDSFPGPLDLIVCRNVLMYFTAAARERAVRRLQAALAPGGRLVLSPLDAPLAAPAEEVPAPPLLPSRPEPAPRVDPLARAREAADRGQLDAARVLCRDALRERPLDAGAHVLLAAVEEESGDLDAALWALRRAIYSAPDEPAAHFRLGGLLLRMGDEAAGRRSLAAAAALLEAHAPETIVPGGDGLTAGRLLAAAQAQLEPAR